MYQIYCNMDIIQLTVIQFEDFTSLEISSFLNILDHFRERMFKQLWDYTDGIWYIIYVYIQGRREGWAGGSLYRLKWVTTSQREVVREKCVSTVTDNVEICVWYFKVFTYMMKYCRRYEFVFPMTFRPPPPPQTQSQTQKLTSNKRSGMWV